MAKSKSSLTGPVPAATPASGFAVWLMAAGLVLMTVALYWPVTGHGFIAFDDEVYVTENSHVQSGLSWAGVKWAFLNPVCCNWHPITVLSHMLDCQAFGLNPWGHHLINVLLHALNALLVFWLLRQTTGAVWRSLLVAVLFAVHPLRVESVAWVSERKDVLSTFFGLLALIAYARYAQGSLGSGHWSLVRRPSSAVRGPWGDSHLPAPVFYLLSLGFFALGLMSKPMLVTWPFVMLLLDYWPLGRMQEGRQKEEGRRQKAGAGAEDVLHLTSHGSRLASRVTAQSPIANSQSQTIFRLVVEKIPFFALAGLMSAVTFVVQKQGGAVRLVEHLPLGARCTNALVSYARYVGKVLWPANLAVFYPHPGQWPAWTVILGGGMVAGLSLLFWSTRRRYPFLLMGWLWFLGTLVPVIGLVKVGRQAIAD